MEKNNISINGYGLDSQFKDKKITYEIVGPIRCTEGKLHLDIILLYICDDKGIVITVG